MANKPRVNRLYRFGQRRIGVTNFIHQAEKSSKPENSFWSLENVAKLISTLLAIGGFISGIIIFQIQQRSTERQDFQMKLWERKLEVYSNLADVTGEMVIKRKDRQALDSLSEKFDKIYYSSLILVQDSLVEQRVIALRNGIFDYKDSIKTEFYLKRKQIELMRQIGASLKAKQEFANE